MELILDRGRYHRVGRGQTLFEIAAAFSVPPRVLAAENNLQGEPEEGQWLVIPAAEGNLYCVQGGESAALLCGSEENFVKKNKTRCLYPTQTIFLCTDGGNENTH